MWGPGITAYPERAEISPLLTPQAGDLVLTKWRYSAFARTELRSWMAQQQRTQLIICGVYAHIGCQCTAADAFMSDITPILVSDAVADFSRAKHLGALEYVAGCCGLVLDSEQVIAMLQASATSPRAVRPDDVQNELHADVARLLEMSTDRLSPSTSLFDVGMDSVRLMTLVEQWRGKGYAADLMDLAETPTIVAWASKLKPVSASPR
jgi:bifunctional isochorismate lyase/aryl carrier protein